MSLENRKIIVTGGPTREWLDPVRFISNPSSGKMGIALARSSQKRSKDTVFIHGLLESAIIKDVTFKTLPVESTSDMLDAVLSELGDNTILIMAAAPADYTAAEKSSQKIKKQDDELTLKLKKTPDILKSVAETVKIRGLKNIFTVGFAAETTNLEEYAVDKLKRKNLNMICLNDVSRDDAGFESDTNVIVVYYSDGRKVGLPKLTKIEAAERVLGMIEEELGV